MAKTLTILAEPVVYLYDERTILGDTGRMYFGRGD